MALSITSHGSWVRYTPSPWPQDFPAEVLFCRRESDNIDWYAHLNAEDSFYPGSVKCTVYQNSILAATTDATRLFPQACTVIEIVGYTGSDPQADFGGKVYDPVANTIGDAPVDLLAYAANKRWQKEVGGITVSGIPVATDDRSKLMMTGARVAAAADPEWSTQWAGMDGSIYPLTAAQVVAISDAVQSHVNNCFAIFATVKAGIDNSTIISAAQIDAAFA